MDWLVIRRLGLSQFYCIGCTMITLFVLETLVKQSHIEALVRLMIKWDFIACLVLIVNCF